MRIGSTAHASAPPVVAQRGPCARPDPAARRLMHRTALAPLTPGLLSGYGCPELSTRRHRHRSAPTVAAAAAGGLAGCALLYEAVATRDRLAVCGVWWPQACQQLQRRLRAPVSCCADSVCGMGGRHCGGAPGCFLRTMNALRTGPTSANASRSCVVRARWTRGARAPPSALGGVSARAYD